MGWQSEEHGAAHEGFSAAWTAEGGFPVRLNWRTDPDQDAPLVSAVCACGWHSVPWTPAEPAQAKWYRMGGLDLGEMDDNRVHHEWLWHLEGLPKAKPAPPVVSGGPGGHALVRRDGEDGARAYLGRYGSDGLHCGDALQVQLPDGGWLRGRYEVEWRSGATGSRAIDVLHVALFGDVSGVMVIPQGAFCRRPPPNGGQP